MDSGLADRGRDHEDSGPDREDSGLPRRLTFPESRGFGAVAADWSDARVVIVDKLTDTAPVSLPGELRHSVALIKGPKIVVFQVAGTIELKASLSIMDSNVYIAGQSAPAGGITIKGDPKTGMSLIHIGREDQDGVWVDRVVENVTLRYLRLRLGKMAEYRLNVKGGLGDNLTITNGRYVVLDHLSTSWSNDENISFWVTRDIAKGTRTHVSDVTLQDSLLSEPLAPHNVNLMIGSTGDFDPAKKENPFDLLSSMKRFSIHRNLLTHASHRNPMIQARASVVSNNLVYNWEDYAFGTLGNSEVDFVENLLIEGASSSAPEFTYFVHQSYTWGYGDDNQPSNSADPDDPKLWYLPMGSIHHRGNHLDHLSSDEPDGVIVDPFSLYRDRVASLRRPFDCANGDPRCLYNLKRDLPIDVTAQYPVEIAAATEELKRSLLAEAGASARVGCDGRWVRDRDPIDDRIVGEIAAKSGSNAVADQNDVGGYLTPFAFKPCPDRDRDGMPDLYEVMHGLAANDDDATLDADLDGQINIMEYLNGTDPNVAD